MKKSQLVAITFLSAMAAACANDRPANYQHCVDDQRRVVEDGRCQPVTYYHSGGIYPYYWLYSGRSYPIGQTLTEGFAVPRSGIATIRASSVPAGSTGIHTGGFGHIGSGSVGE